ncbi:MAG: tetratricopeptide repeat protein [Nitrospirae bacterium]|nr:tetratricopeptide repeat protein [Nitrospirota bacterium]
MRFPITAAFLLIVFVSTHSSAEIPSAVSSEYKTVLTVTVLDKNQKPLLTESGFVVDSEGIAAVSCNTVSKWYESMLNTLVIKTSEGSEYNTEELLSGSCRNNVALISFKAERLSSARISSTDSVKIGAKAYIFINSSPAAASKIKSMRNDGLMKLDAAVPQSANGTPVFNSLGHVIGVAVSFTQEGKLFDFVVPVKSVAKEHERYSRMIKKLLGASIEKNEAPSPEIKKQPEPEYTAAIPLRQSISKPAVLPRPEIKNTKTVDKPKPSAEPQTIDNRASTHYSLAKFYEREGKTDEAIEAHKKTVLLDPTFTESYLEIGKLCFKLGRYSEAAEAYRKAIVFRRAEASTYTKLASAYLLLGNYNMAVDSLKYAARIDSSNPDIKFNLGVAFLVIGDKNGAINEYTELKKINIEKAYELLDLIY